MKRTALSIRVQGMNLMNTILTDIISDILPQLSKYIGVKIFTVGGDKTKKFDIALPKYENRKLEDGTNVSFSYYMEASYNTLQIVCKLVLNGGNYEVTPSTAFTQHFNRTISLGRVSNENVLESVEGLAQIVEDRKLNETFDETIITMNAEAYATAQAKADELKKAVHYEFRDLFYIK